MKNSLNCGHPDLTENLCIRNRKITCKTCFNRKVREYRQRPETILARHAAKNSAEANGFCMVSSCKNHRIPGQRWCKKHRKYDAEMKHRVRYGEPYSEKQKRIKRQKNRCANPGCRTKNPGKHGWHTDHDHDTGKIRGELCSRCNVILGNAKDNPKILQGLIKYLSS